MNSVKEAKLGLIKDIKFIPNFDLNINGNNYITIADSTSLDFGTGSFSIYWEDSYPQQQSATQSGIIVKDDGSIGFGIRHDGTNPNSLFYFERNAGANVFSMNTTISPGIHKFLLIRNVVDSRIYLYCDGALVYTSSVIAAIKNINNAATLNLKHFSNTTKTSGNFRNLKIWKGQIITWEQATRSKTYTTGLVLDLPIDEGTGVTVVDRSGNGNNGTITRSTAYNGKEWIKRVFFNDVILKENFKYDKADETPIVPTDWIKGTGTYKLVPTTIDNGVVKKGTNYLECTVAGTIILPITQLHGTLTFDIYKGADANAPIIYLNNFASIGTGIGSGYGVAILNTEAIQLFKRTTGTNSQLFVTANSYIVNNTFYTIKFTNTMIGAKTLAIKGGAYTNFTQLTPSAGTNPITDNSFTSVKYLILDFDVGDRATNFTWNTQI